MRYFVNIEGEVLEVEVDGRHVRVNGQPVDARLLATNGSSERSLRLGHASHAVVAGGRRGDTRVLHVDGTRVDLEVVDERTRRIREMTGAAGGSAGPRPVKAPMPGLVVRVDVSPGEAVAAGQGVAIVEAMKMENELRAEADGVVARVLVKAGEAVEKDQIIMDFQAPEEESA